MKRGIVIAGNMIVDQIKYVDRYPSPSTLATISGMDRSIGGLLCNCAIDLAKLDPAIPIKAIGVVGADEMGDYILERMGEQPSIDLALVRRAGETSYTDVMTDPHGARTFFQYRGANALLCPADFPFDTLAADILHIGYLLLLDTLDDSDEEYPTAMCRVLAEARARGILTSIDVVSEDGDRFRTIVPPALPYTDLCTINELEAERITGIPLTGPGGILRRENLRAACEKLMELGVKRRAVIHTPELSCGMDRDAGWHEEPSWKIPKGFKRSSVGAGDAFASGILLGAYRGWSLAESIHTAGAIAAYSLSGAGAADAILPLGELMARMESMQY